MAEKIADVEGRTTRRAYANLTSKDGAKDSGKLIRTSFDNSVRKSGRARNPIDYARLSTSEANVRELATEERTDEIGTSIVQGTQQMSPSTSASSNRSTLMPEHHSRSTSTSTAVINEQAERPKRSWNAIVYEVLANADAPLTFTQLTQEIKSRYPFFKASSQEKVLKSGLKNPLYFHEAFCKGEIIDGKQTWGLKAGEFVDKKTGEVLTPQPRNPISSGIPSGVPSGISSGSSAHVPEMEVPSPPEMTHPVTPPQRPRGSNPRFGREILNSPEIPDSPDAVPTTPSPQGPVSRVSADPSRLEERELDMSQEKLAKAKRRLDFEDRMRAIPSPEIPVSVLKPQPHCQLAISTIEELPDTATIENPTAETGVEYQSIRTAVRPIDHESFASKLGSWHVFRTPEQRDLFLPGGEDYNNSPHSQNGSKPGALADSGSPIHVSHPSGDSTGKSLTSYGKLVSPTIMANPLPCTQLYVILIFVMVCRNVSLRVTG